MKPAPFAYLRPGSLADALAALAEAPDAKVLAGGQSLVPLLSMRLAAPATLVDINGLPGLADVTATDDGVRIGAVARHADVLASDDVRRVQPLVTMALAHVAHPTIRNRGTTVGSLVHADAAAEMPVVLRVLGGAVEVGESPAEAARREAAEEAGVELELGGTRFWGVGIDHSSTNASLRAIVSAVNRGLRAGVVAAAPEPVAAQSR